MKNRCWFLLIPVLAAVVILAAWLPFRMTVDAMGGAVSLCISRNVAIAQGPAIGEVLSARAECSKTNYLGGGRYSIDSFIGPIHYREDAGSPWLDIDTTFNPDGIITKAPYQLEAYLDNGMPGFHIRSRDSGEYDIRIKEARADSTSITPIQYTKVIPVISGNKVLWRNCFPNIDVELVAHNSGATLQRIIKSAAAAKTFDVSINEISKGSLFVAEPYPAVDNRGQEILMISSPIEGGRTETLSLQVISPDPVAIQYPITDAVDVQVGAGANDGRVYDSSAYDNNNTYDYIGYRSFHSNELWHLFTGVTIPVGADIDSANISYYPEIAGVNNPQTRIYGNDTATPSAPANATEFNALVLTDNYTAWNSALATGAWRDSPDISAVIQELVDSYDYSSGGSIQFKHTDETPTNNNYIGAIRLWEYSGNNYGAKLHIEYTEAGGEPDISTDPTSKAFGILQQNATHWSKGLAPTFPIDDGECFFILTNDGDIEVDLTANVTDPTGGTGATCVDSTPGANQIRISLFAEGDGSTDNTTIVSGTPRAFYSGLAASANISWEVRLELGTSTETPPTGKTFTIKIIAAAS